MAAVRRCDAEAVVRLRTDVLRSETAPPLFYDADDDPTTLHFCATVDGVVVGVATFLDVASPIDQTAGSQLRGMAVVENHRGTGVGRELLQCAERTLIAEFPERRTIWCNARESARSFYEKSGFAIDGEVFEIAGIGPHYVMWKTI